jgi:hypothetical protein
MKKLVLAAVLAVVAYGGWRWQHTEPAETSGSKLVFNRFWIDHLPAGERDTFNVFIASQPESIGAFAEETMWRGQMEKFRFEVQGDQIRAVFPWSGDREELTVRATRCDQTDMDFCLEVIGSKHGVSQYYSRNGWERRQGMDDIASFRSELLDHAAK